MDWNQILLAVIAAIAALITTGAALKFVFKRKTTNRKSIHIVSQKNNTAHGDIIAGDSVKNHTKQR